MKEHVLKIRLIVYLKRPCVCHNSGRTSQQKPAIIVLETNLRNFKFSNQYGQHTVITKTAGLWECVPDSSYYLNSDIRKCFYYSLTQTWEEQLESQYSRQTPQNPWTLLLPEGSLAWFRSWIRTLRTGKWNRYNLNEMQRCLKGCTIRQGAHKTPHQESVK